MADGKTLIDRTGFPAHRGGLRFGRLRSLATTLLSVAATIGALDSTAAALGGAADAGVVATAPGDVVVAVSPLGFAWRDGIRPGQRILRLDVPGAPSSWVIETEEHGVHHVAAARRWDDALDAALPASLGALAAATLALIFLRGHRRWASAAASLALVLSTPALAFYGKPESAVAIPAAAAAAPALWIIWRPRMPLPASALGTMLVVIATAAWAMMRLTGAPGSVEAEGLRDAVASWGTIAVFLVTARPADGFRIDSSVRPSLTGVATVALVCAIGAAAVTVFAFPPILAIVLFAVALIVLPSLRQGVGDRLERSVLADLREHARLEVGEAERAHLARELHDAPMQELAGVIRRLEMIPEASHELANLRGIAEQLRVVATELRPSVLDDLGLAAAVEFIAERSAMQGIRVTIDLSSDTGLDRGSRPPADVELATFRIAQEAIGNAIQHAGAKEITVQGLVARDRIEIAVTDDGRGLGEAEKRAAARRGRLGLASMRRRAEAIEAQLTIEGSAAGTRVAVRWAR